MFPRFDIPLKSEREPELLSSDWAEVIDAYEKDNYKVSLYYLLKYLSKKSVSGLKPKKDIDVEIQHTNILLSIKINDEGFSVQAPFLKITNNTNIVALLRKISEINFDPLNLSQIILDGNLLYFAYACPLELCEPKKILNIIREICFQGDYYSPKLQESYQAEYFVSPIKKTLSVKEKGTTLTTIRRIFEDYDKCMQFFEKERLSEYHWDIIVITLLKLETMSYLNGTLRSDLYDMLGLMYSDNEMNFRVDRGIAFIKELKAKDEEELISCMYHSYIFCTRLKVIDQEKLTEILEQNSERFEKSKKEDRYLALTYDIYERLLHLISLYNVDDKTKNKIYADLREIKSDTDWEDAADNLYQTYQYLRKGKQNRNFNFWIYIIIIVYIIRYVIKMFFDTGA